jgi:hypothetical protein
MRRNTRMLAAVGVLAVLAACGGSGHVRSGPALSAPPAPHGPSLQCPPGEGAANVGNEVVIDGKTKDAMGATSSPDESLRKIVTDPEFPALASVSFDTDAASDPGSGPMFYVAHVGDEPRMVVRVEKIHGRWFLQHYSWCGAFAQTGR